MPGRIRVGIGGWTFEPWRGVFYPPGLVQSRELAFASRAVSAIEINGTFYSTFKPDIWRRWRDETPDDFVFSVKASRYATNRKVLADAGPAVARFLGQGLDQLGDKLGPINWQFAATKTFDADDFAKFLKLLPKRLGSRKLRHVLEVRHPSFVVPEFYRLARKHGAAIVYSTDDRTEPIDEARSELTYARLRCTEARRAQGVSRKEIAGIAEQVRGWAQRGDVFVYFIAAAKVRNPAAAMALMRALDIETPAAVRGRRRR